MDLIWSSNYMWVNSFNDQRDIISIYASGLVDSFLTNMYICGIFDAFKGFFYMLHIFFFLNRYIFDALLYNFDILPLHMNFQCMYDTFTMPCLLGHTTYSIKYRYDFYDTLRCFFIQFRYFDVFITKRFIFLSIHCDIIRYIFNVFVWGNC